LNVAHEQRREVALPKGIGRNGGDARCGIALQVAFVVEEEEGLVVPAVAGQQDRSAERAAELVARERRRGRSAEGVAGLERVTAVIFESAPVETVGPAAGDEGDLGSGPPVLRRGRTRSHFELLNVDVVDGSGGEQDQLIEVAAVQRQGVDLLAGNGALDALGRDNHWRGIGGDLDAFGDGADLHGDAKPADLGNIELDAGSGDRFESVCLNLDVVDAGQHGQKYELASGGGLGAQFSASPLIDERDRSAGDRGAGRVDDIAVKARVLRTEGCGKRQESDYENSSGVYYQPYVKAV
jgi:hypothetical protein